MPILTVSLMSSLHYGRDVMQFEFDNFFANTKSDGFSDSRHIRFGKLSFINP